MQIGEKYSDGELVLQILEGNYNAFSLLHRRYETRLLSYAFKRMRNYEDAQDIVQETFIEMSQHLPKLKEPQKFSNWMFGIASQLIATRYRKRQRLIACISLQRHGKNTEAFDVAAGG